MKQLNLLNDFNKWSKKEYEKNMIKFYPGIQKCLFGLNEVSVHTCCNCKGLGECTKNNIRMQDYKNLKVKQDE